MRNHFKSWFQSILSGPIYWFNLDDRKINDGKTDIPSIEKDLHYYFKGIYLAFRLNDKENAEYLERKKWRTISIYIENEV